MSEGHERVADALGEVVARIQSVVRREMAQAGISLAQGRTLATLEREGPRPLTWLAEVEQVTQPSMSYLVGRMEAAGLILRSADPDDRRLVIVSITAAGRAALGEIIDRRNQLLARKLGGLEAADQAALRGALPAFARLLATLEERRPVAPSH
jgi:DNA-binding MarR family transcriptional regulator